MSLILREPHSLIARAQHLCRCLKVSHRELAESIEAGYVASLEDAQAVTGAGTGCMACHCAVRELIAARLGQCPPASASPTCASR
jgi:bacterioferritin-associated ferredoxin